MPIHQDIHLTEAIKDTMILFADTSTLGAVVGQLLIGPVHPSINFPVQLGYFRNVNNSLFHTLVDFNGVPKLSPGPCTIVQEDNYIVIVPIRDCQEF